MQRGANTDPGAEKATITMFYLIGFLMTTYPYAATSAALVTDAARDLFARLAMGCRRERPRVIRGMVEQRYGKRR